MKILCGKIFLFLFSLALTFSVVTHVAQAATNPSLPFEISGWIPYWRTATGTVDAIAHINSFTEINPFGYTVKNNGTLFDAMGIASTSWQTLIQTARTNKVKVIPTVMWSDGNAIDTVLRSPKMRTANVKAIVNMVATNNFDGVDIDYEGKKAVTEKYFSLFLSELYKAMGKKLVVCSIEPRTPLSSRFDTIPANIQYANDFSAINKYCDRVNIMTYDQGVVDLRLNDAAQCPYTPLADPKWVEKVVNLAAQTISKKKIVIGVPTYGYEYEVTPIPQGYQYDLLWAFNPKYAVDLAAQLGITPTRNSAGELSFMYTPTSTPAVAQSYVNITPSGNLSVPLVTMSTTTATSTVNQNGKPFRLVWWSDANAINDKVTLAKKLGVRGIGVFKIDGGEDQNMWQILK